MIVTDDFKADIQRQLQKMPSHELVDEYSVISRILNTKGVGDSIHIDLYLETMEVIQDEICRRFCEMVMIG